VEDDEETETSSKKEESTKSAVNKFTRVSIEEDSSEEEEPTVSTERKEEVVVSVPGITKAKDCHAMVFFNISIGGKPQGRITIKLMAETPRTSENFRCLCTGEKGIGKVSKKKLTFLSSMFHRVIPQFMAQGGDFTNHNGTGGESIYGEKFADENFIHKHTGRGILSMANSGPNTNGSQFFLCFGATPHLNNKHVVFGKVTSGLDVLSKMEKFGTPNGKPTQIIEISNCGEILDSAPSAPAHAEVKAETKKETASPMIQEIEPKKVESKKTEAKKVEAKKVE